MTIEEQFNRRASLVLVRVRIELAESEGEGDVRHLIREVAHRAGVAPQVEVLARDAFAEQERLARPAASGKPKQMTMLALAQAALLLRTGAREAA